MTPGRFTIDNGCDLWHGIPSSYRCDPLPTSPPSALRAFAGLGPSKGRTAVFQCDCTNVRCTSEAARFIK